MTDPLYGRTASDGLHVLKDKWCQKKYLKEQCQYIAENLDEAITVTEEFVPRRTQGFQLNRAATVEIDTTQRERLWERSMFLRWSQIGLSPVRNCWDRLVAFQVPLFDEQGKSGWGYVDLLGVGSDGRPVIVELKKEPKASPAGITVGTETPLRMLLEAACYGIAIRKNWELFRPEFVARLQSLEVADRIISKVQQPLLAEAQLVCAAPAPFWIDWLPVTEKGEQVDAEAWDAFGALIQRFSDFKLPVSFASISGDVSIPGSLAIQPLKTFPMTAR